MKKRHYLLGVLAAVPMLLGAFATPAQAHVVFADFPGRALAWTNSAHNRIGVMDTDCSDGRWARVDVGFPYQGRIDWVVGVAYDFTCDGQGVGVAIGTSDIAAIRACVQGLGCSTAPVDYY